MQVSLRFGVDLECSGATLSLFWAYGPVAAIPEFEEYCRISASAFLRIETVVGYLNLFNAENRMGLYRSLTTPRQRLRQIAQLDELNHKFVLKLATSSFATKFPME